MATLSSKSSTIAYEKFMYETQNFSIKHHFDVLGNNTLIGVANWHEEIEVLCFTHGEGTVICNLESHPVKAGDVVILYPYCLHRVVNSSPTLEYHCLLSNPHFIPSYHEAPIDILISDDPIITDNVNRILCELTEDLISYGNVLLGEFIALISRFEHLSGNPSAVAHHLDPQLSAIREAIRYVHTNFQKKISIADMCALTKLSSSYFSQCFRKTTGYSFVDYLNLIRCEKAYQLISSTPLSINECALSCGFQNKSYFTRKFREIYDILPSDVRHRS